ncbi:MAG: [Fe-Fe] hydrogenase large subunit C-terminal domain-containing protein [Clostridia bacterium]
MQYLDFKTAKCKNCYKCLRACPVKAIKFVDHQAKIVEDKCILCGTCIAVCPQNAKKVHSEIDNVLTLLASNDKVIASIAPSFVSSFDLQEFTIMEFALKELGFDEAQETAIGASLVTKEYVKLLKTGLYNNFITSSCPAVNNMIQKYYPEALKYLAPVASPMVAHARLIKEAEPKTKVVFIGPCIAKKKEAFESGIVDAVLTFEELLQLFEEHNIDLSNIAPPPTPNMDDNKRNIAKYYPINRGIIKSTDKWPNNYEYVTVDGVKKCFEVLEDIGHLNNMFIEMNCCEYACINGPASLKRSGGNLKANEKIREYVGKDLENIDKNEVLDISYGDLLYEHPKLENSMIIPTENQIKEVLARIGKTTKEDELNCGACGYSNCREKAIAVINGLADIDMCIPYMRMRAESMSYEIIQNSPNGIVVIDSDYKIIEINEKANKLLGVNLIEPKGMNAFDCFDSSEFIKAISLGQNVYNKKVFISKTKKHIEMNIVLLKEHKILFGIMKDITDNVEYNEKLKNVRLNTLETTDEVIKKQMRVAQEIASLLGETTAETKVALLKLKKTLQSQQDEEN